MVDWIWRGDTAISPFGGYLGLIARYSALEGPIDAFLIIRVGHGRIQASLVAVPASQVLST